MLICRTVFYGQFKCSGPGADHGDRVKWSRELTEQEAKPFISLSFIDGHEWLLHVWWFLICQAKLWQSRVFLILYNYTTCVTYWKWTNTRKRFVHPSILWTNFLIQASELSPLKSCESTHDHENRKSSSTSIHQTKYSHTNKVFDMGFLMSVS